MNKDYEEFQRALMDPNSTIEIDDGPTHPAPTGKLARVARLYSSTGYAYISAKDRARRQEVKRRKSRSRRSVD